MFFRFERDYGTIVKVREFEKADLAPYLRKYLNTLNCKMFKDAFGIIVDTKAVRVVPYYEMFMLWYMRGTRHDEVYYLYCPRAQVPAMRLLLRGNWGDGHGN